MKKSLLFAGAIFLTSGIAIAKTIDFNTQIRWNTKVIENALKVTGFKPRSSVGWVHDNMLHALLSLDKFSARQAVEVCIEECNKSDMLKHGLGSSLKKCPQLCEEFASTLVIENNKANNGLLTGNTESKVIDHKVHYSWRGAGYITGTTPVEGTVVITFKDEEGTPEAFCKKLTDDAFKRGLKYPMECEGKCKMTGNDIITVVDSTRVKHLNYEVDDFCDGWQGSGEYAFRVHYDGTIDRLD